MTLVVRLAWMCMLGAVLGRAADAKAQDAAAHAQVIEQFKRFDASENGYLSGNELDQCGCRAFDSDGDGRVTALEYLTARGVVPGAPNAPVRAAERAPAAPVPSAPASPPQGAGNFKAGDRVRAGCYGAMYDAVVDRVGPDGRAWVRFEDQKGCDGWRELARLQAAPVVPGTRGGDYAVGAPVEAQMNGRWHMAVILAAEGGRYRVHYENYSSSADAWLPASKVRQTPERARHRTGSGGQVPPGKYECYAFSYGSGLRYQSAFSITGAGTYADLNGARGTFTKDAGGIVRFNGGAFGGSQGDFQYNAGRAMVYMHTPGKPGKRAGMDCEGPKP